MCNYFCNRIQFTFTLLKLYITHINIKKKVVYYRAGGSGGGGGGTFWHRIHIVYAGFCMIDKNEGKKEEKKRGEGGERRGKRVFIQSPTEMYVYLYISICTAP